MKTTREEKEQIKPSSKPGEELQPRGAKGTRPGREHSLGESSLDGSIGVTAVLAGMAVMLVTASHAECCGHGWWCGPCF